MEKKSRELLLLFLIFLLLLMMMMMMMMMMISSTVGPLLPVYGPAGGSDVFVVSVSREEQEEDSL